MIPSEKTRKAGLASTGSRGIAVMKYGFGAGGAGVFLIGSAVCLYLMLTGRDTSGQAGLFAAMLFGAAVLFAAIGFVAVPKISKIMDREKNKYPADTGNRKTKEELFSEIAGIEVPYTAERNGSWLDVTWRWLDEYFTSPDIINSGIHRNRETYKIMFRINNDFTYDMLDCIIREKEGIKLKGPDAGKSVQVGRFMTKKYFEAKGKNGTPPRKYCLDTEEMRDYMRKWLADRGYTEN